MEAPAATGQIIAVACSHAIEMQPAYPLMPLMPLMPLATPWLRQQTVTATHTTTHTLSPLHTHKKECAPRRRMPRTAARACMCT